MGEGSSSADGEEPGKYKGFWEKFNKRIQDKTGKDAEQPQGATKITK